MPPIASLIDHALLHPTLTERELREGCKLAMRVNAASVCVKPYWVPLAAGLVQHSVVAVGTVISFPHGASATEIKVAEADWACRHGAVELDMVINIGLALEGQWDLVARDIEAVVAAGKKHSALIKVIFETDLVTASGAKRKLCEISQAAGADFVKTSTGFGFVKRAGDGYGCSGATVADVQLLRSCCSSRMGVKASGGIRDYATAREMIAAGATRLGTSATQNIVRQEEAAQPTKAPTGDGADYY